AWSVARQPAPAPAPAVKPIDGAKLERSKPATMADTLKNVVPPPVSTPALPKELWRNDPSSQARDPWASPAPSPASTAADRTPLNQDEIRELQGRLKAAGLDPGPIDGVVGPRTAAALQKYGAARALANPEPSKAVLARLRTEPTQSAQLPQRERGHLFVAQALCWSTEPHPHEHCRPTRPASVGASMALRQSRAFPPAGRVPDQSPVGGLAGGRVFPGRIASGRRSARTPAGLAGDGHGDHAGR